MREHIENLRKALLELPATGTEGFEGLLSIALTKITGVPFRLAASGSQFGIDGKATYEDDAVCFECKRYDGKIPKNEVISKIAELSVSDKGNIDLWVLGATTQASTQLVDAVRAHGEKNGITTLTLDWSDTDLPPLAVALAMAEPTATAFLSKNVKDSKLVSMVAAALKAISEDDRLTSHAVRIRRLLQEPTMGAGLAKQANDHWLTNVFCNKSQARLFLLQPLSPNDTASCTPAVRDLLLNQITPLLMGKPDGSITAILGDEGNGKSWLVAQSWLSLKEKPLMIVFTADDFSTISLVGDFTEILIVKLIAQTSGLFSDATRNRWRRKLKRWRNGERLDNLTLVVVIDGLNQRPHTDWGRIIEAMSIELDLIGGRLVITARSAYYTSWVRQRLQLHSPILEVNVPEWTDAERDAILAARGIQGAGLRPHVAASLRNPRLLGIALDLLQSAQIEELEELSVSRLLFEHMRVHERDAPSPRPAKEFARRLQDHAQEILSRIGSQKCDDLNIFDGGLEAVSDGRFFIPVEGDPTRYSLDEDGLTLALGFAVLDALRAAHRNGRDLGEVLKAMIEPISALDRAAEAVFAALTVACLDDEECSMEIGAAVVEAFAELQNPNAEEFPAFSALSAKRPKIFMHAAHRMCLASARQPNFDWIKAALFAIKENEQAWSEMSPLLQSWLGHYSLSPEARMFSHPSRDPAEKVEMERTERQNEINTRLDTLSTSEKKLLNTLVRKDNGDLATLSRLALMLIAGKPIAPFAMALAHWSFANALNAAHGVPNQEFTHLVRLNRVDWWGARESILRVCNVFEDTNVSRTGKWSLVSLLRATGDPGDAARAQVLVEELTADRERFEGWRLVEKYCATDPCDPESGKPENITKTAETYAVIDVSKIRLTMGCSAEDHFFAEARPGVVRFEAQLGIDKHREFIADVLERNGFSLRQGVFEIHNHNALVTHDHADRLVGRVMAGTAGWADENLRENERWIVSQYHLILAFPFLSVSQQLEAVLSEHAHENILLGLLDVAKPLDEDIFEAQLDKAIRDNDERAQFVVLALGRSTTSPASNNTRRHLIELTQSTSARVREQALGLTASIGDEPSINAVVTSGWSAAGATSDRGYEIWYGSCVILEAAARGMIPYDEALSRCAPQLYGRAATKLGVNAARAVSRLVDASIRRAIDLELAVPVPDIKLSQNDGAEPIRYRVSEKSSVSSDPSEALRLLSEDNEAFEERQKRIQAAFDAFDTALTKAQASIIIDGLQIQEFDVIVAADRKRAESWFDLFMSLPKTRLAAIHNIALLLAHALADEDSDRASRLFIALDDSEPLVRITYGRGDITLDAMALWSAKDHLVLEGLRFDRLDRARNDDELALEVLAALWNDKQALLQRYIEARLQTGQPAEMARALMVAGFSDNNKFNDEVLARYQNTPGFLGSAQLAAIYAYKRNAWSVHWYGRMREAKKPEDFWCYSVLFTKIVDGRFDVWRVGGLDDGEPYRMFWPSVKGRLKHRCEKWRSQREKKLFGEDAPSKLFLKNA